ncbi:replication regulatory RepB family protein [Escherichia coli 1-110-08_S1_C1]|uniref:replication regulatory protein RepA n=1 Tax=Escherichia coli TaxID=562 RepID=UPI00044B9E41|nr:replication regulatory protein RepA [Escherichia coli]EYE31295.1 replication regulatory RepB family protein [Escherichia coli 1-110-08_S1_C1]
MSQTENTVTSSSGNKRAYRKGNPLTLAERQQASLARKSNTHKAFHAVIQARLKAQLQVMCEAEGVTQAEMIAELIKQKSDFS